VCEEYVLAFAFTEVETSGFGRTRPPVTSDVEVKWTRQDFCEQRDPEIAKALDLPDNAR
jgi:hypothetical protein